jgi:hypothetical protein
MFRKPKGRKAFVRAISFPAEAARLDRRSTLTRNLGRELPDSLLAL